jgi:hypothetical protein
MYCPSCHHPNPADAEQCVKCHHATGHFRERVFVSAAFVFAQADAEFPVALKVDDAVQTYRAPAILSLHQHAVGFGDEAPVKERGERWPLPDAAKRAAPALKLLAVITDRKIYKPGDEAGIFVVAPDAPGGEAALEIKLSGQKVYEAKVALNREGLAFHRYADFEEGEYTVVVALPSGDRAECAFSAAEFTLSPLIAALEKHAYAERRLKFTLKLLVLARPYSGPVEFGLQCKVCGERVVATQKVSAKDGVAEGDFDLSGHGGPFHVQVTTPDGHTALVAFPGTGAMEREHITVNPLGQTVEAGLLPWEGAEPVRGLYLGAGEVNMTPLTLESAHAGRGKLTAAAEIALAQLVIFNPRTGAMRVSEHTGLERGAEIEFDVDAPYTVFYVGAFTKSAPFVGWGVVVKPEAITATLTAPQTARPGEEIDVHLTLSPPLPQGGEVTGVRGAFCLLLVYDARLEHESPLSKLAQRIYESVRDATMHLPVGEITRAAEYRGPGQFAMTGALPPMPVAAAPAPEMMMRVMAAPKMAAPMQALSAAAGAVAGAFAKPQAAVEEAQVLTMVVAPTRMEFPELAFMEFFYFEGEAARTVRLGDQIGTWRARAYVLCGVDCLELTSDVQADKPLYAELDAPAIASAGDAITAAVNYHTREPADLVIATPSGETRARVTGSGAQTFLIAGPGRVEVRIENPTGTDWSQRDVAPPGVQKVTASRLMILDKGETARGEKVVVYASMGHVLRDTIDALLRYPFG